MAQPLHIELHAGPDGAYRAAVLVLWTLAACSVLASASTLPWPLLLISICVLAGFRPGTSSALPREARLRLYRTGAAELNENPGRWHAPARISRWAAVVRVDTEAGTHRALVCASRNLPADYRRLMIWTRFPPVTTAASTGAGAQR